MWAAVWLAMVGMLHAQAPGVKVEPGVPLGKQPLLVKQAEALLAEGKLLSQDRVIEMIKQPAGGAIDLPAPRTQVLGAREVAALARKGFVRVGWFYRCQHCEKWHLNLAGGYVINAQGAVATCAHCIRPMKDMREGYLIAVNDEEKVFPVSAVLAANEKLDAAVIRIVGGDFLPLPLCDDIAPGDAAFLYSEPFGRLGYFSSGMVNRFYWDESESGDAMKLADVVRLRMNVSTEWAPGSSGAAILDQCGNAIGHVSTISPMTRARGSKDDKSDGPAMITLHAAVPARGVKLLMQEARGN